MEFFDFIKLLKRKKGTIFSLVFIVVILCLGFSLLSPLKYGAKSRLLVVQNTGGVDPYTVSKSNEYLGNLFSQVAYSGSFYNLVVGSTYDIDKSYFSGDYNKQLKTWGKTISTKTFADTGIIEINVYHPNPYQAQQIALAVNDILINKNSNYQGGGETIKVNTIDQPLVSNYPVKPNLPQNLAIALIASLLLSLFYVYIFPEECYNIRLQPKRKIKKIKINSHSVKVEYPHLEQEINRQELIREVLAAARAEQSTKQNYQSEVRQNLSQNYQAELRPNYNQDNQNNQGAHIGQNEQNRTPEFRAQGNINNILK